MSSENQEKQQFSPGIVTGFLEGLKNEKETCEFSDARVVIDNFEFRCHRVILAACSGFFKAVFTSGMKEDLERKVILAEITKETFADILECMYAGSNIINDSNMFEIWHAANQLQILFLLHECEIFLKQKINTENCLAIYQHGKLLDSKEMVQFSWSYIVNNFESVRRSEELLMLTEEEMEKLIGSPDLKTVSEDHVLETILSWVDYKPPEIVDETCPLVYEHNTPEQTQIRDTLSEISEVHQIQDLSTLKDGQLNESEQPLTEGLLSEYNTAGNQYQDISPSNDNQSNGPEQSQTEGTQSENHSEIRQHQAIHLENYQEDDCEKQTKSSRRADYLINLLKLTRVCLLSGKCLVETMSKINVRTNKAAQEILQNALEYILRTDRRHVFCPASAIHRSDSHLENVIVATEAGNSTDILVCRRQDGQWYGLGNHLREYYYSPLITCFNNDVYLSAENARRLVYETSRGAWRAIPDNTNKANAACLLTIGNFIYAVRPINECLSVEVINALDPRQCINVCSLPLDLISISCSTVIGDNLLFFGSVTGKSETQIVIFDTATLRCFPLNNLPSLSSPKVCFSNGKDSFVLQRDGTLYRIQACSDAPFIEIVYETMLWDFDRDIRGALLFNNELWLFGPSFSISDTDTHWELSLPGVFNSVKNIICNHGYACFMHVLIPKEYLHKKIN